ncbi:sugar ABC transporter substrate-binding protein [Solihabitans fulvus]|uniref:Sugar ABC transporter substrate-binding protein n=1 Tax=Solihabitans fulvus TaxID=1892852 RepID=A0A5B2XDM9_9PSEU|nr:substrate-binding domain-containing protein [Solihabitans fulvus]KAA2261264.1 sugar ABC transporter substrate-binding protein [Solihabitans fulvus]
MRAVVSLLACGLVLTLSGCAASPATGPAGGGGPVPKPKVGVILPDTASSARWTTQDLPQLSQSLRFAGIEPDVENAQGDEQSFADIADNMIRNKVRALLITPLSGDGGIAVERKAKLAGIPVIDYDRLSLGGSADYYVSFDSVNVGTMQGDGLVRCLAGRPTADIIELEGAPTDNNATLFAQGQQSVLGPRYNGGGYRLVASQRIDRWDPQVAARVFEQNLVGNGGHVDGVLAANDGLAGAVIDVLRRHGLAGRVAVTGQDATLDGLRAVLRGEQCMTVYKPVVDEAEAAARLAAALAKGDRSGADDLITGNTKDVTGQRDVKSVLLGVQAVARDSVQQLVSDNVVKAADLCAGDVAPFCAQAGIA